MKSNGPSLVPKRREVMLDVRNVYWLLAAMTIVVAPHLLRLPTWVSIFFTVIVGRRLDLLVRAAHAAAARDVGITVAATVGTFITHGRLNGKEGGVTLLIIMAALKVLEMKSQRDVVLCIYLGFFLVVTNFLFSQSIPLGFYMLLCVWIFVATLVGFNHVGRSPSMRERLRPAAVLVLQALPLMAAFFLLFPRVGPLWALPQESRSAQSGLTDTMSPGNIANLIKSDAVVFRVQFEDQVPPYQTLYWRGPVLTLFDGGTWRRREFDPFVEPRYSRTAAPTSYAVDARRRRAQLALRPRRARNTSARLAPALGPAAAVDAARDGAQALRAHVLPRLPLWRDAQHAIDPRRAALRRATQSPGRPGARVGTRRTPIRAW